MNKKKNHSPLSPSDSNRWRNCPGSKKVPRIIYGPGGIGKTSFGNSINFEQLTEEKKK